jgi:hypothetical protein
MATVPSTENNANLFDIQQRFDSININECIITRVQNDNLFDEELDEDPEENPEDYYEPPQEEPKDERLKNMLGSDNLTVQANAVLASFDTNLVFDNESYSWGDCDEYGPTEHFWTLYVALENQDGTWSKLKFYREVFDIHGDKDEEIEYEPTTLCDADNKLFDTIYAMQNSHNDSDDYKPVIYNIEPSQLSKPGKVALEMVRGTLFDHEKIFFIGEEETHGEIDSDGPREYFWNLYIFAYGGDGIVIKRQFYREFYWRDDYEIEMDDVPYKDVPISEIDLKGKTFHL